MTSQQEDPKKPETPLEIAKYDLSLFGADDPYYESRLREDLAKTRAAIESYESRARELETTLAERNHIRQIKAAAIATVDWKAVEKKFDSDT